MSNVDRAEGRSIRQGEVMCECGATTTADCVCGPEVTDAQLFSDPLVAGLAAIGRATTPDEVAAAFRAHAPNLMALPPHELMRCTIREVGAFTWAGVAPCRCGVIVTAVSHCEDNVRKMLTRKFRKHYRAATG